MKTNTKFLLIFIICLLLILTCITSYSATSSEAELIELLNEYKEELGDLEQFKIVITNMCNHLSSATAVDEELKTQLRNDINGLDNVSGMNPVVLEVLKDELETQIEILDETNINELREEAFVVKEWTDEQTSQNTGNTTVPTNTVTNTTKDNLANTILPYAGLLIQRMTIILFIVLMACAIFFIVKYHKLKDIK